jgi:hypothetical protein
MLTKEQIIDIFVNKINELPNEVQLQIYESYTEEDLHKVLDRNLAIRKDPTYGTRLAEDYIKFLAATPEEQSIWQHIEPIVEQ